LYKFWLEDHDFKWEAAPKPRLTDASYKVDYLDNHDASDIPYRLEKVANRDFVTKDWEEPLFDAADVLRLGKDLFVQVNTRIRTRTHNCILFFVANSSWRFCSVFFFCF
jgi:hypothetical protein